MVDHVIQAVIIENGHAESLGGGHDLYVQVFQRYQVESKLYADLETLYNDQYERLRNPPSGVLPGAQHYRTLIDLHRRLCTQRDRFDTAFAELQRVIGERQSLAQWETRRRELVDEFLAEYGALGPHYRLLCYRLASAVVRVEQLECANRTVEAAEWRQAFDAVIAVVQAMQKHTESVKTEITSRAVNRACLEVIAILEREIAVRQGLHQAWSEAVQVLAGDQRLRAIATG